VLGLLVVVVVFVGCCAGVLEVNLCEFLITLRPMILSSNPRQDANPGFHQ